jgi:hypothetical protein
MRLSSLGAICQFKRVQKPLFHRMPIRGLMIFDDLINLLQVRLGWCCCDPTVTIPGNYLAAGNA